MSEDRAHYWHTLPIKISYQGRLPYTYLPRSKVLGVIIDEKLVLEAQVDDAIKRNIVPQGVLAHLVSGNRKWVFREVPAVN